MGHEVAILFSDLIAHIEMAGDRKVISAGQFDVVGDVSAEDQEGIKVYTFGESVTLKAKSRGEEDSNIIKKMLQNRSLL